MSWNELERFISYWIIMTNASPGLDQENNMYILWDPMGVLVLDGRVLDTYARTHPRMHARMHACMQAPTWNVYKYATGVIKKIYNTIPESKTSQFTSKINKVYHLYWSRWWELSFYCEQLAQNLNISIKSS